MGRNPIRSPVAAAGALNVGRPRLADGLTRPVTVTITPALLDRLDRAAEAEAVPRSVLVREMVADGLDRLEGGAPRTVEPSPAPIPTPFTTPIPTRPGPAIH